MCPGISCTSSWREISTTVVSSVLLLKLHIWEPASYRVRPGHGSHGILHSDSESTGDFVANVSNRAFFPVATQHLTFTECVVKYSVAFNLHTSLFVLYMMRNVVGSDQSWCNQTQSNKLTLADNPVTQVAWILSELSSHQKKHPNMYIDH